MAKMQSPVRVQTLVIIGAIVAGAAVAVSLFVFYPDMMLENTSLDPDSSGSQFSESYGGDTASAAGASPQAPMPQGSQGGLLPDTARRQDSNVTGLTRLFLAFRPE